MSPLRLPQALRTLLLSIIFGSAVMLLSGCGGGGGSGGGGSGSAGSGSSAGDKQAGSGENRSTPTPTPREEPNIGNPPGSIIDTPSQEEPVNLTINPERWTATKITSKIERFNDMNNNGDMVGDYVAPGTTSSLLMLDGGIQYANGAYEEIDIPDWYYMRPRGINDHGHVVGHGTKLGEPEHAYLYQKGVVTIIPAPTHLAPRVRMYAYDVGNSEHVVGWSYYDHGVDSFDYRGFVYFNGVRTDIEPLPGTTSTDAVAVNELGMVVGNSTIPVDRFGVSARSTAFIYHNSHVQVLNALPGYLSTTAHDINIKGQVVGHVAGDAATSTYINNRHPFIFSDGVMREIPIPGTEGSAEKINKHGQVVGYMYYGQTKSLFLYSGGETVDLNTLPAVKALGVTLEWIDAINDKGQVLASGVVDGYMTTYLLSPY